MHLLGARRAIVPYLGSKWRYRRELEAFVRACGYPGAPDRVELYDPGSWGLTHTAWGAPLIRSLEDLAQEDPRAVFERLTTGPRWPQDKAAEHLYLQRLAYGGKEVWFDTARQVWRSPGFNATSAYGVPATDRFGEVQPLIPSLIRAVESWCEVLGAWPGIWYSRGTRAETVPVEVDGPTLVYIDPPYNGVTGYRSSFYRDEVVRFARAWHAAGASVLVSEAKPLELPGFQCTKLNRSTKAGASPVRGTSAEYVMWARGSKV